MSITLSATFANALMAHDATAAQSAVVDQIVGGSLVLYACATPPDGANEAITQHAAATVLATFALDGTVADFGAPTAGVQPLKFTGNVTTPTVTATATGTASFFRILSSGATSLLQGLVATSASDWNLSSVAITSGDNVSITGTPTLTLPVT